MFRRFDENGNPVRFGVITDCSKDPLITEQSHKAECDINQIIKRHGVDMIERTARLRQTEYRFDDVTGNDFQEAMEKVVKAEGEFLKLPSKVRDKFDNSPAKFLDYIQNPDNVDGMRELGLVKPEPETPPPVQVMVVNQNPETPPE